MADPRDPDRIYVSQRGSQRADVSRRVKDAAERVAKTHVAYLKAEANGFQSPRLSAAGEPIGGSTYDKVAGDHEEAVAALQQVFYDLGAPTTTHVNMMRCVEWIERTKLDDVGDRLRMREVEAIIRYAVYVKKGKEVGKL